MDRDQIQTFVRAAEADLALVRAKLLIVSQSGDTSDIGTVRRRLERLRAASQASQLGALAALTMKCSAEIGGPANLLSGFHATSALDVVAEMEAELWATPGFADQFDFDVAGFVDESFDNLFPNADRQELEVASEGFEIDEETLEIFRAEAEQLLANISGALLCLAAAPDDQAALWDVRRNAHTLKGAAGIVGLREAGAIAHKMEDLLDKMVETRRPSSPAVLAFLHDSADALTSIITARADENPACLKQSYEKAMGAVSTPLPAPSNDASQSAQTVTIAAADRPAAPIVRVSLDRLDEIIKLADALNESLARDPASLSTDSACRQTSEILSKLRRLRMVRFSTLETRLSRAVNVTCHDELKRASIEMENGDIEVDTQIVDALIEPLLHLLKNAVVHGIEPPDMRRLIGKDERGRILIKLETEGEFLVVTVADDGGGIPIPKLIAEALSRGVINEDSAAAMHEDDALHLIFDRGLTTAAKLDMNAGRGVGMNIVKESVEGRGGTVSVASESQKGTRFTLRLPLHPAEPDDIMDQAVAETPGQPPLVLVVDDSASVRHQTAKLVKEKGFRVITAENGADALELLLSGDWEPDLIISDVEMPQIDGWALLEYLKTDDNFGHIPVVMVTSLDSDDLRQRAFDLGASDYIVKPVHPGALQVPSLATL